MTEAHTFKLTTAENELGVVIACSEYGKFSYIGKFPKLNLNSYNFYIKRKLFRCYNIIFVKKIIKKTFIFFVIFLQL